MNVSWVDSSDYCKWLSEITGRLFSLPSAEQWEYAARGPESLRYPWGNDWDGTKVVFNKEEMRGGFPTRTEPVESHPEGASPFGMMHMLGNGFEWANDGDEFNPHYRYVYGGTILGDGWELGSALRDSHMIGRFHADFTFRIVEKIL